VLDMILTALFCSDISCEIYDL